MRRSSLGRVLVCGNCGRESEGDFAFCPYCAAPLTAASAAREQRKTVTVLFCDITGSTTLGESTDPEALRALLARYFERMKGIVESHGGTVEKFIGDAVMAVFGIPAAHEDDALRACRAAVEMRDALPGLSVQGRIGVNTGEVVTGTAERLVTGDAVNVAARLEQAARPGDVLVGEATLALVREAAETEPVEPLALKGKAEPVPACRLLTVREAPERRHEAHFVGRSSELGRLWRAWQRALGEQRCELVTVVGDAGVGKSRLVSEFLGPLDVKVVRGRCLSYGEGITYWPLGEALKQLGSLPADPAAAAPLRSLLGETDEATSAEEIAWAFRKLLEQEAPLIAVFDDIHWAEETFLDLLEGVALLSSGAPILLLCLARPELAERRPQWPLPLRLEPLPQDEVEELLPQALAPELRERIAHAAGGNPLYLTEIVAMSRESEGEVTVPPTLKALLAARLDLLGAGERPVLERGAVEGEIFHRGAVQTLLPDEPVAPHLTGLARKGLIRPHTPQLVAEEAFRFKHLLIRDAAYGALSKAARAELHERFAAWLEEKGQELVELDEILGHHLEQAAQYRAELGQPDPALAERAGELLAEAARRAGDRGDFRAAASLLQRALALLRPLRLDVALELGLASVFHSFGSPGTDTPRALAIAEAAAERAVAAADEAGEAAARAYAASVRMQMGETTVEEVEQLARKALPLLEAAGDHANLIPLFLVLGFSVAAVNGRYEQWAQASEQAFRHARLADRRPTHLFGLGIALVLGPRPADEALATMDALAPGSRHPGFLLNRGHLLAMLGRFDEAWATATAGDERLRELQDNRDSGTLAEIAECAGDYEAAATFMSEHCDLLAKRDSRADLSTCAPWLGRVFCVLKRHDEAEPLARVGRELGDERGVATQALWRQVQALVHASRGEHRPAETLAREAVAIAEGTDGLNLQGKALCDLAEVLAAAGRFDEAAEALEQALERYERKKNLAMVAQIRPRLEELRAAVS
jgi:class 3 adenylate cyclase/tetratricopeptide (TPR) repeat protein